MIKTLLKKMGIRGKKKVGKWTEGRQEARKDSNAIGSSLKTTKRRCPNNFCSFVYDKENKEELHLHFEENHPLDTEERARRAGF